MNYIHCIPTTTSYERKTETHASSKVVLSLSDWIETEILIFSLSKNLKRWNWEEERNIDIQKLRYINCFHFSLPMKSISCFYLAARDIGSIDRPLSSLLLLLLHLGGISAAIRKQVFSTFYLSSRLKTSLSIVYRVL